MKPVAVLAGVNIDSEANMKKVCVTALAVTGMVYAGWASAWCFESGYTLPLLGATLNNKTVVASAAEGGTDDWNEDTCVTDITGGKLYHNGDGTSVDPREEIGTWSHSLNTVTYNYTGVGTYSWDLWTNVVPGVLCWDNRGGTGGGTITAVTGTYTTSKNCP